MSAPNAQTLPALRFTTQTAPRASQFQEWRSFIHPALEAVPVDAEDGGFVADMAVWDIGSLALFQMTLPSAIHRRTPRHIRKEPIDHWCLTLPKTGFFLTEEALIGRKAPGRLHLRSLGRPFETRVLDCETIGAIIPRDLLGDQHSDLDYAPEVIPGIGRGGLLIDYLLTVEQRLPSLGPDDLPQLAAATRAMVAACLTPTKDRLEEARSPIAATLFERVRQAMRSNLARPAFGVAELCRSVGISRSHLYRLFEHHGGVARYLQRQRLLAAHAQLSTPGETRSARDIADGVGFSDASSFSRAFRSEFGYSPGDARAAAQAGMPKAAGRPPASGASELRDLLWRLSA
jgi:AraC-like DNA-binding protein